MYGTGNRCDDFGTALAEGERRSENRRYLFPVLAVVLISVGLSLVPLGVDFGYREKSPADCVIQCAGVNVQRSEAEAVAPAAPYALAFLESAAAAAGMGTSDFVITCLQMMSVTTGYNYLTDAVSYGASDANYALEKIIETAEYPEWDDLTETQQAAWDGNETNYNAARFNSFMNAFGLEQVRDGFYANGGGSIDGDDASKLERIGAIGLKWASGVKEQVDNVVAETQNMRTSGYVTNLTFPKDREAQEDVYWPSGLSRNAVVNYGYDFRWYGYYYSKLLRIRMTNSYVCALACYKPGNPGRFEISIASPSPFIYTNEVGASNSATSYTKNGKTVYLHGVTEDVRTYPAEGINIVINNVNYRDDSVNNWDTAWSLIYGLVEDPGAELKLPGAPEGLPSSIEYPDNYAGLPEFGPDTTYNLFFDDEPGEPPVPPYNPPGPDDRPENPYNPSDNNNPANQSGTPEWKNETTENLIPLQNIHFDRLFPFSMLFNIPRLFDKVQNVTYQETISGAYDRIVIPIWSPGGSDDLELDLGDLHDLLLMVRPFVQILLAAFLLFTAINFWRSILTG